jgi:hypothetical protein
MLFKDGNMHSTAADATGKEETNSVHAMAVHV